MQGGKRVDIAGNTVRAINRTKSVDRIEVGVSTDNQEATSINRSNLCHTTTATSLPAYHGTCRCEKAQLDVVLGAGRGDARGWRGREVKKEKGKQA